MISAAGAEFFVEAPNASDSIEEQLGRRKPPEKGRFRLQVDRQTKVSCATREAAEEASLAIKRAIRFCMWRYLMPRRDRARPSPFPKHSQTV